jgi:uncharacterized protein YdhG (YjbR/CyaY superfamily)
MESAPSNVDEYIEKAPEKSKANLRLLRSLIREVAPDAPERISYGMPCYGENGRRVYFGYAKAHIGLYGISSKVIEEYREEVGPYLAFKGTVRLPLDKDLPLDLVRKLVMARMKEG